LGYPGEHDEITKEEYENGIKIVCLCLNWVENKIKETKANKSNNTARNGTERGMGGKTGHPRLSG
jgi:hypothetical protein